MRKACYCSRVSQISEQPYRENVQMISQRLAHHEFEVSLAIRLPSATAASERTDDDDMDAFLGSLGFEFINAQNTEMPSAPRDRGGKHCYQTKEDLTERFHYYRCCTGYRCPEHHYVAVYDTKYLQWVWS